MFYLNENRCGGDGGKKLLGKITTYFYNFFLLQPPLTFIYFENSSKASARAENLYFAAVVDVLTLVSWALYGNN